MLAEVQGFSSGMQHSEEERLTLAFTSVISQEGMQQDRGPCSKGLWALHDMYSRRLTGMVDPWSHSNHMHVSSYV